MVGKSLKSRLLNFFYFYFFSCFPFLSLFSMFSLSTVLYKSLESPLLKFIFFNFFSCFLFLSLYSITSLSQNNTVIKNNCNKIAKTKGDSKDLHTTVICLFKFCHFRLQNSLSRLPVFTLIY